MRPPHATPSTHSDSSLPPNVPLSATLFSDSYDSYAGAAAVILGMEATHNMARRLLVPDKPDTDMCISRMNNLDDLGPESYSSRSVLPGGCQAAKAPSGP